MSAEAPQNLTSFSLLAFGPALLPLLVLLPLFALNAMIGITEGSGFLEYSLLTVGAIVLPLLVLSISHNLCRRFERPIERFGVIYLGWFVLVASALFVFTLGLGGVSQAAVEGVTIPSRLESQALSQTLFVYGWLHLFIVPWIVFAVYKMAPTRNSV